jgi:hypothetical protein
MAHPPILIKKASGLQQPFEAHKLQRSLRNAGADDDLALEIVADIEAWLHEGVTSKNIYSRAFHLLHKKKSSAGLRYKLKQAMLEMGPTGYPFEVLMGELFLKMGYSPVEVAQVLQGCCVTHEMDVIATQNRHQHLMECKYHSDQGKQVSVQVPLYVRSRVNDIIKYRTSLPEYEGFEFTGWVITNTRFSEDSINYGTCAGLKLLAWSYPEGNGLKEMLEREKVLPVTILSKLSMKDKQMLMDQGIATCQLLLSNLDNVDLSHLTPNRYQALVTELEGLCR